jgi:hypothetical protein
MGYERSLAYSVSSGSTAVADTEPLDAPVARLPVVPSYLPDSVLSDDDYHLSTVSHMWS